MKNKALLLLILLLGCSYASKAVLNAGVPMQSDTAILTLRNLQIVDVNRGVIISGKEIVIKEGMIFKIRRQRRNLPDGVLVDLKGAFIMPGLIDGHVHVTARTKNNMATTYKHLNYLVSHGITSVRDAGGDGAALVEAKNEISNGKRRGPDIYFSAFMAGDWYYNRDAGIRQEPYFPWEQRLVPGDNLDEAMVKAKSCGATGVKLYHSFDAGFLKDIVKAAKKYELKVWGHSMIYPAKPVEVVHSGVQVLSHVSMLEGMRKTDDDTFYKRNRPVAYRDSVMAKLDIREFAEAMKANHAILDATICVSVQSDPWVLPLLKRLHQQGVEISAGTDQIVDLARTYPYLIDELSYFVRDCGFSNADALRSATIIAAKVIGQEKNIGRIDKGRRADLIAMKENPLERISALKDLDIVIKAGKILTVN